MVHDFGRQTTSGLGVCIICWIRSELSGGLHGLHLAESLSSASEVTDASLKNPELFTNSAVSQQEILVLWVRNVKFPPMLARVTGQ